MNHDDRDVAATLERLYPPVIGGPGWDDVLDRFAGRSTSSVIGRSTSGVSRGGVGARRSRVRRKPARWSNRALLAAAIAGGAVAATPAVAFSTRVRQLVGLNRPTPPVSSGWTRPPLVAKVTSVSFPRQEQFGLPMATVRFTIGEAGEPPGTGITFGSSFLVHVAGRAGTPSGPYFVRARGARGHYVATVPRPRGGIGSVEIGGWINVRRGPSAANGTFWIPVAVSVQQT